MTETYRQIVAGLIGAGVLAGLTFWGGLVLWFNLAIGAAVGLGTYFTIPRKRRPEEIEVAPGVTLAQQRAAMAKVDNYIKRFRSLAGKSRQPRIDKLLRELVDRLQKIGRNFEEDPRALMIDSAVLFLDHYLERAGDLVEQYVRVAGLAREADSEDELAAAESAIGKVLAGVDAFYQQCIQNDLMDLEVNSETLLSILDADLPPIIDNERSRR